MYRIWVDGPASAGRVRGPKFTAEKAIRRAAAVLCAAFCLFALVSCGRTQGVELPSGKTAATVGDHKVTSAEYDYYYLNRIDDGMSDGEARAAAEADLKRNAAVLALAKEYDVGLGDAERRETENELAAVEEALGAEAFAEELVSFHMTRETYIYVSQMAKLEAMLREYITDERSGVLNYDDKAVLDDIHSNFMAVKQVLIKASGDDEADRKKAEEAFAEVMAGTDFDEVIAKYGEDDAADPVYGRYFTHGMYPETFEENVKMLANFGMAYFDTEVGYHIVMRIPLEDEYIDKNFEQLRYLFFNRCVNELLDEKIASMEVKYE